MSIHIAQITSAADGDRAIIIIPERVFQHQKERMATLVRLFLEKNPMSPEAFAFELEGTIYRVTQDEFEGLLVPLVDEFGSPVSVKNITITPRTIREFILRLDNDDVSNVRQKTWKYFYAFFESLKILQVSGHNLG